MPFLKVYKNQQLITQFELSNNEEYILGRAQDSHIKLDPEPGISRHHARICGSDQQWEVQLLSRIGILLLGTEKREQIPLENGRIFQIPPYEFQYFEESVSSKEENFATEQSSAPQKLSSNDYRSNTDSSSILSSAPMYIPNSGAIVNSNLESAAQSPPGTLSASQKGQLGTQQNSQSNFQSILSEEKTIVATKKLSGFLKLLSNSGKVEKIFKLDGEHWVAGREISNSVFIDHNKLSRHHFEITKEDDIYKVRDAGSANGTIHNGNYLSSNDWVQLQSGDLIQVADLYIQFEIKDESFETQLAQTNSFSLPPVIYNGSDESNLEEQRGPSDHFLQDESQSPSYQIPAPPPLHSMPTPDWNYYPQMPLKQKNNSLVRIIIIVLLVVGAWYYYTETQKDSKLSSQKRLFDTNNERFNNKTPFESLTPEKKEYVKQAYLAGQRLFQQGKYELSRQEMMRIHTIIPQYEDSKQIEELTNQALQQIEDQRKIETEEAQKKEIEEKISKQVAFCRTKINSKIEVQEIDLCLSNVIEFNPDHPGIKSLKSEIDSLVEKRALKESEKNRLDQLANQLKKLFEKAQSENQGGDPKASLEAYENVVKSSLPDPTNLKSKAQREIASIRNTLSQKQIDFQKKAEQAKSSGNYKEAVSNLQKALKINPENEVTKGQLKAIMNELKKKMQSIYQESILEENMGEVESAKEKWKKIIDQSAAGEDYYEKAKAKLKKYGAF